MAFVFSKLLLEDGSYFLKEDVGNILLEDQSGISFIIDYTHIVHVDQHPRTVYVGKVE